MSSTMPTSKPRPEPDGIPRVAELGACVDCGRGLKGQDACPGCGRRYHEVNGILSAIGPLNGRNRVAAEFYDGPGWARFRRWERLFLEVQGGKGRARRQILRNVNVPPFSRVLEVGIGDGENLGFVPRDWLVYGVDLARSTLESCLNKVPNMAGKLSWAEAEALPFLDGIFDATFTVGGFNYFRDHEAAMLEMRRVTRPGGVLVIADELPNLHRFGIGNLIGVQAIDRFWLESLGLDPAFVTMVFEHKFDPDRVVRESWPAAVRHSVWGGLGYCFVDTVDDPSSDTQDRIIPPPRHLS